ncbi:MAG: hypothetical protein GX033_09375 [Firmicutes bacterium]|nr:hypothetical protein [Bacillota bacterium]
MAIKPPEKLILFNLDNQPFGLDVTVVDEILSQVTARHVPHAAPYLTGVFDFRGKIMPLLDLRVLLSLANSSSTYNVIVVNEDDFFLGLIVDKVLAVITDSEQIKHLQHKTAENPFIHCFVQYKEQEVAILDLAQLVAIIAEEEKTHVS